MKKSIIAASAASVALAAMPVVGTFAAQTKTVTDNILAEIESTCSLTRTGVSGTNGTWHPTVTEDFAAETYSVSMAAGTTANLGTSTFTIVCNDQTDGHYLSVRATGLTAATGDSDPAKAAPIAYGNSAVGTDASTWNITVAKVAGSGTKTMPDWGAAVDSQTGIVSITQTSNVGTADLYGSSSATNKSMLNGAQFTATYNIGTKVEQPVGTYSGDATYTLTHGA